MVGCIEDTEGNVVYVGTSQNFPRMSLDRRQVLEAYQKRRSEFVGPELWDYDRYIQDKINSGSREPTVDMAPEFIATQERLKGHQWAVFRGHPIYHILVIIYRSD